MRSARFNDLLAGTAVAFALTITPYAGSAFAATDVAPAVTAPPPAAPDASPVAKTASPTTAAPAPQPAAAAGEPLTSATPAATPPKDAATETVTPAPATAAKAAAPATAETAVADRLRDQLETGKFDRILGSKKERSAVETFYATRQFAPLWIANGVMSDRAKAVAAYFAGVEADGLEPADYIVPEIKAGASPEALAEAEIRFTDTLLTYARHAEGGRVHYTRVSSDIQYTLSRPEAGDVLAKIATAKDVATALDSFEPPQPGYKALKAKLAEIRNRKSEAGKAPIPQGPVLKYTKTKKGQEVVMNDPRVPALRERLGVTGDATGTAYDKTLADAVAKFQKANGLRASGQLNTATLEAINGPKREKTADIIIANMERWRWMPRDLGRTHVIVNIPDYTLRVMHDGKQVWKTNIVVGKPNLPTPLISAEMKFITVNPTWNVPPSIIQNEYLPALQQDPQAMERIGLKVEQNKDGTIRIYQPPGDRNALGRIRFNFPNKFLVYQHDTPDKQLFAHSKRAYSHGCMRVENPLKYGEVLLSLALPNEHYTAERLHKMFGGSEVNINFPQTIPVHLTYQTAFVDDAGNLQIRDDVYGRDARLLAIMKGSERKVADIAIDRPRGSSTAPVKMPPGSFGGSQPAGGFFSGPSFFERLFGGAESQPAPRPRAGVRQSAR
jgi:murein L,D-transpeptidase YcbB/YkuD